MDEPPEHTLLARRHRSRHNFYLDVPPDVTIGGLVVVVGGGGGDVVGVVVVEAGTPAGGVVPTGPDPMVEVVVGAGGLVVVLVETGAGVRAGTFALAEEPGCSFATMTPMNVAPPPARTIASRVSPSTRACARARADGVCRRRADISGGTY
jgi:hypothetical protein